MKKSYIAPEIKTMIIDNVVMAATSKTTKFSLGSKDDYATDLGDAHSRQSSSWDDED